MLAVVAAAGLLFAVAWALVVPLPAVSALGTTVAWCGPGAQSDPAMIVWVDPPVVNEGERGQPAAALQGLETLCTGMAHGRVMEAGAAALLGIGSAVSAVLLLRRPQPPYWPPPTPPAA